MSARTRQTALCLESIEQEMIASRFGGEPIAPEDCFTRVDVSERVKAIADAEWAGIPDTPAEIAVWMRGEPIQENRHG